MMISTSRHSHVNVLGDDLMLSPTADFVEQRVETTLSVSSVFHCFMALAFWSRSVHSVCAMRANSVES